MPPCRRVIIADDEPHARTYLKCVLQSLGVTVIAEASSGLAVLPLCRTHQPDAVILDLNMPDLTGEESLQSIKKDQPDMVVVVLSSVASRKRVEQCRRDGAAAYILKDTPFDVMLAELRQSLSLNA